MTPTSVKIYGLYESIIASGYPMKTQTQTHDDILEYFKKTIITQDSSLKRAIKLGNAPAGSGHDIFLKGIIVQFDVDFTKQLWSEAQRYHWFDFVSSCSTMHKLADFDLDEAYINHVDQFIIDRMKALQQIYNNSPTEENFLKLIYSSPVGIKLGARITTNYLQLKTIYAQRKNHRLPEWQQFCEWIETLPITTKLGVCK